MSSEDRASGYRESDERREGTAWKFVNGQHGLGRIYDPENEWRPDSTGGCSKYSYCATALRSERRQALWGCGEGGGNFSAALFLKATPRRVSPPHF
jgi:hypothetical protein